MISLLTGFNFLEVASLIQTADFKNADAKHGDVISAGFQANSNFNANLNAVVTVRRTL